MFGQDRNQMRLYFQDTWKKKLAGTPLEPLEQLIAGIIEQHPEYHSMIMDENALDKEFTPEGGQTNPFLHMGMHITLAEQLGTDRPAGLRDLHQRMTNKLGDPHEAEHKMMDCLGLILWEAQRSGKMPDEQAYVECIKKLL